MGNVPEDARHVPCRTIPRTRSEATAHVLGLTTAASFNCPYLRDLGGHFGRKSGKALSPGLLNLKGQPWFKRFTRTAGNDQRCGQTVLNVFRMFGHDDIGKRVEVSGDLAYNTFDRRDFQCQGKVSRISMPCLYPIDTTQAS